MTTEQADEDALEAKAEFARWYWKACDSSQPYDWMKAALAAQQVICSERPAALREKEDSHES